MRLDQWAIFSYYNIKKKIRVQLLIFVVSCCGSFTEKKIGRNVAENGKQLINPLMADDWWLVVGGKSFMRLPYSLFNVLRLSLAAVVGALFRL